MKAISLIKNPIFFIKYLAYLKILFIFEAEKQGQRIDTEYEAVGFEP